MQPKTLRCAIYTRKSTDEGLEQEFNSLDAQREACAAYVTSQRHEGWTLLPEAYEDGGYSGGSMKRPALQQLMADIEAGKIDIIVVYKVDRLTRSLADFAKIVEILDAKQASFVSITQAFNTTTSMGRLTLNVLLSFAQFEREVTGERIRDKIAASKAKGMWMGGTVPLGYDVKDRKLVVNETEASLVRQIYLRYLELGSGQELATELAGQGYRTKVRQLTNGSTIGGRKFTRGMLFYLLSNRLYLGELVHKGDAYQGEHDPIIDRETWTAVQKMIEAHRVERKTSARADHPSLLAGLVHDGEGRRMSPSHAVKGSLRYRYYMTHSSEVGEGTPWRVPSHDLERIVIGRVRQWLNDAHGIVGLLPNDDAREAEELICKAKALADQLAQAKPSEVRGMLPGIVAKARVERSGVRLMLKVDCLLTGDGRLVEVHADAVKMRIGKETKLVMASETIGAARAPDDKLAKLIAHALQLQTQLLSGTSLADLAAEWKTSPSRLATIVRLSWLAPDIIGAIADGTQPRGLTKQKLLTLTNLPLDWPSQRLALGYAS